MSLNKISGNPGVSVRVATCAVLVTLLFASTATATEQVQTTFRRVPTQYIAALGDPNASSGTGAETWGLWRQDPGPRGVWLFNYEELMAAEGVAPAQWRFDPSDWWVDENGLIMEQPDFPVPAGQYVVTGDRETVSILTVHPADDSGSRRWEISDGAVLYDVTHLPCRSARYTPKASGEQCTPTDAQRASFPVAPGAEMPEISRCDKQDYAVLFVIGIAVDN